MILEVCDVAFTVIVENWIGHEERAFLLEFCRILAKMAGRPLPLVQEFLRDCLMNKQLIPVDRYLLQLPQSIVIFWVILRAAENPLCYQETPSSNRLRSTPTVGIKPPLRKAHTDMACQYTNTGTREHRHRMSILFHINTLTILFLALPSWSPPNSPYPLRRSPLPKARLGRV